MKRILIQALAGILLFALIVTTADCQSSKSNKQNLPSGPVQSATDFGGKGNAVYKKKGNPYIVESGYDNAVVFDSLLSIDPGLAENKLVGVSKFIPDGVYKTTGTMKVQAHNVFIKGNGRGVSTIHPVFNNKDRDQPALLFGDGKTRFHGGGISNLTIQSEPYDLVRNNGVYLDYMEYMSFDNIAIEGFNKTAIRGSLQESYFSNLVIFGCGAGLRMKNGVPEGGVIDYNSTLSAVGDASNNTLFSKLTLSSCYGTHINLVAPSNTTENIHFDGYYDETDPFNDAGPADNMPVIYMKGASNISFNNGFITVNSTGSVHDGIIVRLDDDSRNGKMTFDNFHFNMNPSKGYLVRQPTRLRSVMQINGKNSRVMMGRVTVSDPADMIGFGISERPYLFEGNGSLSFEGLELNIRSQSAGGTRSPEKVFDPSLHATGWLFWRPFDQNGPVTKDFVTYYFENGVMVKTFR